MVDASVVLRWLLVDEPDREPALAVRDRIKTGRLEPRQPPHFPIEVASALVVAGRAGRLEPSTIGPLVRSLEAFRLDRIDPTDFASAAVETALELGLRVPDAAYIVCARRTGGTLITADRRLFEAALRSGAAAALLGELAPWGRSYGSVDSVNGARAGRPGSRDRRNRACPAPSRR